MTNKSYKAIFVTPALHNEVKMLAVKNKLTMIQLLELLIVEAKKKSSLLSKRNDVRSKT